MRGLMFTELSRVLSVIHSFASPAMIRFLFKFVLCILLAVAAGFAYLAVQSGDPVYAFYEWMSPARFHQYDRLIRSVAIEHHLDPMLVKACVVRSSTGKHNQTRCPLHWPNTTPAPAGRSDGAAGMTSPRYRREPSSKISTSPERRNMSNQSSRATNSTSDAAACENAQPHKSNGGSTDFRFLAMRLRG